MKPYLSIILFASSVSFSNLALASTIITEESNKQHDTLAFDVMNSDDVKLSLSDKNTQDNQQDDDTDNSHVVNNQPEDLSNKKLLLDYDKDIFSDKNISIGESTNKADKKSHSALTSIRKKDSVIEYEDSYENNNEETEQYGLGISVKGKQSKNTILFGKKDDNGVTPDLGNIDEAPVYIQREIKF